MFLQGDLAPLVHTDLGATVSKEDFVIEYRSTRCDRHAAVACPKGESPNVEVHVESRSIIFDFSNVEGPDTFADTDFDGFVIEVVNGRNGRILYAAANQQRSNLDVAPDAIAYDSDYVHVNLAGLAYDSEGFLEIELLVGPLNLIFRGE